MSLTMTRGVRIRPIWDMKERVWPPVEKIHSLFLIFKFVLFYFHFSQVGGNFPKPNRGKKKKKLHGNFYELLVPKHQRHLLY